MSENSRFHTGCKHDYQLANYNIIIRKITNGLSLAQCVAIINSLEFDKGSDVKHCNIGSIWYWEESFVIGVLNDAKYGSLCENERIYFEIRIEEYPVNDHKNNAVKFAFTNSLDELWENVVDYRQFNANYIKRFDPNYQ